MRRLLFLMLMILCVSVSQADIDTGLVAYYDFEGLSGTTIPDVSGNGHDGISKSGLTTEVDPTVVAGPVGDAMDFDNGNYVEIANHVDFQVTTEYSLSLWTSVDTMANQWGTMFSVSDDAWRISRNNNGNEAAFQASPNAGGWGTVGVTDITTTKRWVHLVGTYDNGEMTLYVDTVVDDTHTRSAASIGVETADPVTIGAQIQNGALRREWDGQIDDVRFYNRALSADDVQELYEYTGIKGPALSPTPSNNATDVLRDTVLTWMPGTFAATHDVYLGTSFEDVNTATPASDAYKGSQALENTSYDPGRLELGVTYFWRIDEVNDAHPEKLWQGETWSFEVEPEAILVEALTATASSQNSADEGPENTINGVGLNEDGSHSQDKKTMWLSAFSDPGTAWIRYDLPAPQKLNEMLVWNHNTQSEEDLGYGVKDALIEVSADGINFTSLGTVELLRAAETTVDMQNVVAQSVRMTAQNNWGGLIPRCGLSAVRLYAIPTAARELSPADGAADVDAATVVMTWRAGREAVAHNVYVDANEQAVIDGTAPMVTVTETSYVPDLNVDTTYYWRVDEVNDAEVPAVWVGGVQSLTTAASIPVDDMESYEVNMWETWADGYDDPTNGALVGNGWEATPETEIVYEGSKSMPMTYGDAGIQNSWATRAIDSPKDWSQHGIKSLSLFFHGSVDNVVGQLYVKVNDTQFDYQGAATDIQTAEWYEWTIDLSGITAVDTLTVGVLGGSGQLYVDNMRLYPSESE
ncbi:LamG-like jellyroll fold domain-containing protein [Planctomycetota bacterium]